MKNKIMIVAMTAILVIGLTACGSSNNESTSDLDVTASTNDTAGQADTKMNDSQAVVATSYADSINITEEVAKQAALSHAGLTEEEVTFINIHLDIEDGNAVNGRQVYEVEFYSNGTEYDYEIDAASGDIIGFDYDVENYTIPSESSVVQSTGEYIGEDEAKSIALAKVSGAAESDINLYLDHDDDIAVYEGTIIFNEFKYEFEINATDGTIIEWSAESVYDD